MKRAIRLKIIRSQLTIQGSSDSLELVVTVSKSYILFLTGIFALLSVSARAQSYGYSGSLAVDGAQHLLNPSTPASEKLQLKFQQKGKFDRNWSGVLEGHGWVEGVYAGNGEYPKASRDQDLYEARFQNAYIKWQDGHWDVRAGNQQQMWGETFASGVADIVNPKDLRFGIPMDPSRTTLATPMVSLKYVGESLSVQALYILQPMFNILPLPGEDYFPKFPDNSTVKQFRILRERELPMSGANGEYGLRLSGTFAGADVSVFGMNYFDRNPYYIMDNLDASTQTLSLRERHARVTSEGLSFAAPVGESGYMIRGEGLYTASRLVNILARDYSLTSKEVSEFAGSLTLEFPTWRKLNFAMQYQQSQFVEWAKYVSRKNQDVEYVSARVALGLFESSTWATILTWSIGDSGYRILSDFTSPISNSTEFSLGTEIFGGSSSSDFSQIQRASRVYVQLRFFFSG